MERRLEKRIELDATPEQVWEAVATGPGISTWFVPHRVDPESGTITADFGGGNEATGRITGWEPGRRIAYGSVEPPPEGPDYAFEFLVEARAGGGAMLRFVQSGFTDESWENEYRSFDGGWDLFFGNLAAYLTHFAGRPVHNVVTMAFLPGAAATVWPVLHRALDLATAPAVGDEVTLRPEGPAPISGVVDIASEKFLGVRSAHGLHRIGAEGEDGCGLSAYHYFYGESVDEKALTVAWQEWLDGLLPAPAS